MGIHIDAPGASFEDDASEKVIADRPLFADASLSLLLEAGDERAAFQIASRPGKIVAKHHVEALGLAMDGDRVVQAGAASAPDEEIAPVAKASAPANDKAAAPAENKAAKPEGKKRRIGRRKSGE